MSDMRTNHSVRRPSVYFLWLVFALCVVAICRGDVRDFVTQDIFNKIVSGDVLLSIEDIVTQRFFSGIMSDPPDFIGTANNSCPGRELYTYSDFITAANSFSDFGTSGTSINNTREIAAFFTHVAHQTDNLCTTEHGAYAYPDLNCNSTTYPCVAGKQYYGRGPLQLAGNDNYGAAGKYLGLDLLNNPDLVARNDSIAWKTALWIWNVNTRCHIAMTSGGGFKLTISAIDGGYLCARLSGFSMNAIEGLVDIYKSFCYQLGAEPENIVNNGLCWTQAWNFKFPVPVM